MIHLKDKTVLITGASSGIGRQCAIDASKIGANVILVARNYDRLQETLSQMQAGNHLLVSQSITEYDKLEEMISSAVAKLGKISGFIHSAGIEETIPLRDMTIEKYNEIFSVNVFSGLELAKVIQKKKNINSDGSSFVFLSSVMGILGQSGKVAYCSSKSALISAVKAMALELANKKIRVNSVLPGVVMTEMTEKFFSKMAQEIKESVIKMHPLGLGEPTDVSNLCMFLLSDLSNWITGSCITVDGGYTAA